MAVVRWCGKRSLPLLAFASELLSFFEDSSFNGNIATATLDPTNKMSKSYSSKHLGGSGGDGGGEVVLGDEKTYTSNVKPNTSYSSTVVTTAPTLVYPIKITQVNQTSRLVSNSTLYIHPQGSFIALNVGQHIILDHIRVFGPGTDGGRIFVSGNRRLVGVLNLPPQGVGIGLDTIRGESMLDDILVVALVGLVVPSTTTTSSTMSPPPRSQQVPFVGDIALAIW